MQGWDRGIWGIYRRLLLGVALLLLTSCEGGLGLQPQSWSAWILPPVRTRGDWRSPPTREEQARLTQSLNALLPRFQDCVFRHDARSFATGTATLGALHLLIGVDIEGRVRWLELEGALDGTLPDGHSLHSCFSSVLLGLSVRPPPKVPSLVQLHLPRLSLGAPPVENGRISHQILPKTSE